MLLYFYEIRTKPHTCIIQDFEYGQNGHAQAESVNSTEIRWNRKGRFKYNIIYYIVGQWVTILQNKYKISACRSRRTIL